MNDVIKEIAKQCGAVFVESSTDYFGDRHPAGIWTDRVDLQKFAELIVRKCADICEQRYATHKDLSDESVEAMMCSNAIKEHFGVKA